MRDDDFSPVCTDGQSRPDDHLAIGGGNLEPADDAAAKHQAIDEPAVPIEVVLLFLELGDAHQLAIEVVIALRGDDVMAFGIDNHSHLNFPPACLRIDAWPLTGAPASACDARTAASSRPPICAAGGPSATIVSMPTRACRP